MKHLLERNGRYYYNRRVPDIIREFHKTENIRIALGTDSKDQAINKAVNLNAQVEQYWQTLIVENKENTIQIKCPLKILLNNSVCPKTALFPKSCVGLRSCLCGVHPVRLRASP